MMKRVGYIILLTVLAGCSKVYKPDIEKVDPFLVVEGHISTLPGTNTVYITKSKSYNENPYFDGLPGAEVRVSDDRGNTYNYSDVGTGMYTLRLDEGNTALVGRTYTLKIITPDGNIFESSPQKIVASPPIKTIDCSYNQQTILTEDSYGDPMEITFDGFDILAETQGILASDNYYFYSWLGYEEHHSVIQYVPEFGPPVSMDLYRHRPLNGKYSSIINTANADEYDNFHLQNKEILFIVYDDLTNYVPPKPDTFDITGEAFNGLLFRLRQSSLSPDAYDFYNEVEKQLDAGGRLFDPVSPLIAGNIQCVNDPEVKVIGVFYAADVAEKYEYLYMNGSHRTFSMDIDSFPQLWLDTCSFGLPPDWIQPPF
jgi:hypothetical protein